MVLGAIAGVIILNSAVSSVEQGMRIAAVGSSFVIYCTSNQDSTGECSRVDNGERIDCEIVPGAIINCGRQDAPPVQCVLVGVVLNAQAYFSCSPRRDPGVSGTRINLDRFAKPSSPALSPTLAPDVPDPLTPFADPFN